MADSNEALICLDSVSKGFNGKGTVIHILKEADFRINKKETIAVIGASGIGKSTLLNIIGTLDRPDAGRVIYQGKDLFSYSDQALAEFRNSRIGFVFQFHYLLQGFTALENVMIPGLIARKTKKSIEKQALNMLERVGLGSRLSHRAEDLSGGEQQRVAIARALVLKPDLLLADEPTGNLDQKNSQAVHSLLNELNKELGMTMIIVTHNMKLAQMMDKRVTIDDARIIPAE